MNPSPQRALPPLSPAHAADPVDDRHAEARLEPEFDPVEWSEPERSREERGAGGRMVLSAGLALLAALWIGYTGWSAGRALASQPLSSPAIAQWVAIAAGPLGLLGLAWLIFGRTRRREAERFTRAVVTMRGEARSLEALLEVLSQRIEDSHQSLGTMANRLMALGDETTGRFDSITRQFDDSAERLSSHGRALDRAAESARTDIGVLLEDLPRAEASAQSLSAELRTIGAQSAQRSSEYHDQVAALGQRTLDTDEAVAGAAQRLVAHLTQIESAGAAAASRVGEAETSFSAALDALLERTVTTLDQIRSGIDAQGAAVSALVAQASAGLGRSGIEASETLGNNINHATGSLNLLSAQVAEQERASQQMMAEIDRGLTMIDQRFAELAARGDQRANQFLDSLGRARTELDAIGQQAASHDGAIGTLAERTAALRSGIDTLAAEIRDGLSGAIGEAEVGAVRVRDVTRETRPELDWMRDAAVEASDRIAASGAGIADHSDRFAALLASLDDGVGTAHQKLGALTSAISGAQDEATRLSAETGPALVAALLQVRDAAAHAAARARETIGAVIPESVANLSAATREALEQAIRSGVEDRLREVETVAARAVESARAASDRLTQQMLTLGQTASALEQHIEQTGADRREKDSEAFARQVSLLMDSMHSASIDVGKILSDEVDDKAWDSYLKGNRGVFTRRAVRLLGGGETRAIRAHYDADSEFHQSVNRYVHDFEAMLRRVVAERDGGIIAVTLMSSDMGKLYAALAQVVAK